MTQNNNILQELKELESSLATARVPVPFVVPTGYFEGLAGQVMARIHAMEAGSASEELHHLSPLLNSIARNNPYTIPSGFFEGIDSRVAGITRDENELSPAEELESLSPLLSSLKKEMPYSVPDGYFKNIPAIEQPGAKVVSFTRKSWFRYAAAAVITGMIVTSGFLIFKKSPTIDPNVKSYAWVEKKLKTVPTETIDQFVELVDQQSPVIASADKKTMNEVKELLKDVSDKDIDNFLDETMVEEPAGGDDILLMD